jgi:hypothetical protein
MKKTLRIIALFLVAGAVAFWAATGANRGWTRTQVPQKIADPVTGLEGVQWQNKFVPGVDFLAVVALGAGILGVISLFVGTKSK